MENSFSQFEMVLIQQQLISCTDEEIALMIDRPVELVRNKINQLTGGGTIKKSYSQRIQEKQKAAEQKKVKKQRVVKLKKVQKKQEKPVTVWREIEQRKLERKKQLEAQTLPTRHIDHESLISVRIDNKTTIYIKPGEDAALAKEKFLLRVQQSRNMLSTKAQERNPVSKIRDTLHKRAGTTNKKKIK